MFKYVNPGKNIYYCSSRKKMNSRYSIVERLSFRTLKGQRLGLDVHRCSVSRISLFWNMSYITVCYMNYIGRYELDFYVSNQCLSLFDTFCLAGACSRCYDFTLYIGDWIGKVCIYTDPRVSEKPLYLRNHLCCVGWDNGRCQYTGISFLDGLCDVSMTSWCLNSSNLTIHGKCFVKSNISSEEDVLDLIVQTRIQDYKT